MIQPALEPVEMLFAPMPKVDAPTGAGAAVLALKHGDCRWPFGNPAANDFHFCCGNSVLGGPYCVEHTMRSRGAGTPSERNSVKAAMKVA